MRAPSTWRKQSPCFSESDAQIHYDEIINRDKISLDISWIKDKSLAYLDNLPDPDILAMEIVENLEAGLESFKAVVRDLNNK